MQRKLFVNPSCRGMSLVELLLVMAILSAVMLAVMSLYIPVQRSTVVQTQVTDVQANLRLAMNRLSQDLLTAGFLVTGQPIIFENGANNPQDFTIRTRAAGSGFGRVGTVLAGGGGAEVRLNLTSADMAAEFPVNSLVRLIEPVSATECAEVTQPDATKRVYKVIASAIDNNGTAADPSDDFAVIDLDDPAGGLVVGAVAPEAVVVRVGNAAQPAVQTIRYRLNNGVLERIVSGNTQFLVRNVSGVTFAYTYAPSGRVRRVDVTLVGQTGELVAGDAIAGAKTRALESSVTLRNVF